MNISDDHFDTLITRAMNELPEEYINNLDNVAIIQADEPTDDQKRKKQSSVDLQLHICGVLDALAFFEFGI